ncbi:IS110 family transposase [Candidatus Omnitrophota bacterium]
MQKNMYYIGLDIACDDFVASIYECPEKKIITKETIKNNTDGFTVLINWLKEHKINNSNSIICMEATGVYSEACTHHLAAKNFRVSVESPLKVKRAFDPVGHKTDPVDSRQIAEYAYRFKDELRIWQPKNEIVEKIRQLLVVREQFTKQKVAIKNAVHAYRLHKVQVELIKQVHQEALAELKEKIAKIDKELSGFIRQNPLVSQNKDALDSTPGIGMLLSANLIALTNNFEQINEYKALASYIGIVPYKHQSGSSVHKRPRIRHYGPQYTRKLLRLAAQSVAAHDRQFRQYYLRKQAEGKAKALVLNNIANKLLKVACAMIRENRHYIKEHRSIHPMYLKTA